MEYEEIWKPIIGYEEFYEVSNLGRIKALPRLLRTPKGDYGYLKEKYLKQYKKEYLCVYLTKNGTSKYKSVHRLVAETFIPNKSNFKFVEGENIKKINLEKLEINHKNGNKYDNKLSNLEWCTRLYNQREAERLGLVKRLIDEKHPSNKVVYMLNANKEIEKEFYSIKNASQQTQININLIYKHIKNHKIIEKENKYFVLKEEYDGRK